MVTSPKMTGFKVPAHILTDRTDRSRSHLYVVSTQAIVDRDTMNSRRAEHIAYLDELRQSGKLLGAGPVLSEYGTYYHGHGLIILRADSVTDAIALANADPFHVYGMRKFTVNTWLLSEGVFHDAL